MVIQWTTPATEELVSAYECAAAENPAAARRITNHIVGYRIKKKEVWILAVMHAARKWPEEF